MPGNVESLHNVRHSVQRYACVSFNLGCSGGLPRPRLSHFAPVVDTLRGKIQLPLLMRLGRIQHRRYTIVTRFPLMHISISTLLKRRDECTVKPRTKNVRNNPAATCLHHAAARAITPADPIPALLFAVRYLNASLAIIMNGISVVASSLW